MKEKFEVFYNIYEKKDISSIWKDETTLFVFDTNVLLNLYKYDEKTRNDFINVIKSVEDRIWIPFHVGLEYHRNRMIKIKERQDLINKVIKEFEKIQLKVSIDDSIIGTFLSETLQKKFFPDMYKQVETFRNGIKKKCERIEADGIKKIDTFKEEFMKMVDNQLSIHEDNILSEIEKLFPSSRIGENIFRDQGSLDKLDKEGELRFKNKIGPGFCDLDGKKGQAFSFEGLTYQNKFGDLYIFKQIIEHAKLPSIKNVVFISDDSKEDWVIQTSVQGKKYTFPRTELVCELKSESQIDNFMIIQSNKFVEHTSKNQSVHIDKSTVEIIKSVQSLYAKNKMKELDFKIKSLNIDRLNTYSYNDIIKKYWNDQDQHTSIGANINWVELKEQLYELEMSIFTTDPSLRYSDGVNSVAYLISTINASVINYEFYFKNNVRKSASFEKASILELLDALFDQLFVSDILDAHQKSLDRIKHIISMISTSEI